MRGWLTQPGWIVLTNHPPLAQTATRHVFVTHPVRVTQSWIRKYLSIYIKHLWPLWGTLRYNLPGVFVTSGQTQLGNLADNCEPGRKFSSCHEYCNWCSSNLPSKGLFVWEGDNDDNRIRTVTWPHPNKHLKGFYGGHKAAGAGACKIFTNSTLSPLHSWGIFDTISKALIVQSSFEQVFMEVLGLIKILSFSPDWE